MVIGRAVSAANGPCRKCQVNNNGIPRRKPGKSNVSLVEKPCKIADTFLWTSCYENNKMQFHHLVWKFKVWISEYLQCVFHAFQRKVFASVTLLAKVVHLIQVSIPFGVLIRVHRAPGAAPTAAEYVDQTDILKHGMCFCLIFFGRVWSTIALIHDRMIKMHGNLDCSPVHHHHVNYNEIICIYNFLKSSNQQQKDMFLCLAI